MGFWNLEKLFGGYAPPNLRHRLSGTVLLILRISRHFHHIPTVSKEKVNQTNMFVCIVMAITAARRKICVLP